MERKLTESDKKALNAIDGFINDISKITNTSESSWKTKVESSLLKWIGKVPLTDLFNELSYFKSGTDNINKIKSCLENVKDYIKIHGIIPEPEKTNWFYRLSTVWATTLLGIIVTVMIIIITAISINIKDRQYLKLEYKFESLRDSLRISAFKDSKIKTDSSTSTSNNSNNDSIKHN